MHRIRSVIVNEAFRRCRVVVYVAFLLFNTDNVDGNGKVDGNGAVASSVLPPDLTLVFPEHCAIGEVAAAAVYRDMQELLFAEHDEGDSDDDDGDVDYGKLEVDDEIYSGGDDHDFTGSTPPRRSARVRSRRRRNP